MKVTQKQIGFTLIELLLVIALMLIIGTYAVPFFSRFFNQNVASTTSDQLTSELRKAQMYAMMGKQNSNWGVNITGAAIVLYQGASYSTRNPLFDEKFNRNSGATISNFTEVNFSKRTGLPSTTPTITINGANSIRTVSINTQGVVSR